MIELKVNAEYYTDIAEIITKNYDATAKIMVICGDSTEVTHKYEETIRQLEEIPGVKGIRSYTMIYTPFGIIRFETATNAEKLLIGMHGIEIYFTDYGLQNSKVSLLKQINHATR